MEDTLLARFALESDKIKLNGINHRLFNPYNGELSVSRVEGISKCKIIELGKSVLFSHRDPNKKRLYGYALIRKDFLIKKGLEIINDDEPYLHSRIIGWPEDLGERKMRQSELAVNSCPILLEIPIERSSICNIEEKDDSDDQ